MIGIKIYKKKSPAAAPAVKTFLDNPRYNPLENMDEIGYLDDIDVIDPVEIDYEDEVISPFYSPDTAGAEEIYDTLLDFVSESNNLSAEEIEHFGILFGEFADDFAVDNSEELQSHANYLNFASDMLNEAAGWKKTLETASSSRAKDYYQNLFLERLASSIAAVERVLEDIGEGIFSR